MLVENITVDELEEFISYVFTVTVETSEGNSPSTDICVTTDPAGMNVYNTIQLEIFGVKYP